ncbi:hypothetical protein Tco_0710578 [Tanacetum coccineum]
MLSRSRKMGQDEDPKLDQTSSSKGSKSQPKSSGKSVQAEEPVFEIACIICYKIKRIKVRQVVSADYFFNNDLEYQKGGSLSRKYTTSTTKTKAAKYDNIEGIEDMVPTLWSPIKVAYDKFVMWGVYHSREDKRTQGSRKAPSQEFNLHDMKFAASPGPKETL